MKTLNTYLTEANGEVRNKKFLKLMKAPGLEKVLLIKGNGYYYITSDDDDTYDAINSVMDQSIYVNSFNQQTPEQWVEDIKLLLKDTKLVKEGLLSGMEDTLKKGDEYVTALENIEKEFKMLQKLKIKDWKWTSNEAQYYWYCPAFIRHTIGIDADAIIFAITPYEDDDGDKWTPEVDMYVWKKQGDVVSNTFGLIIDNSFYKNYNLMISGVIKKIKKTFVIAELEWLKTQLSKRVYVNIFKD